MINLYKELRSYHAAHPAGVGFSAGKNFVLLKIIEN